MRSFVVIVVLSSAMAFAQGISDTRTAPDQNPTALRQESSKAESYYGLIGLLCLLGLAGLRKKVRTDGNTPIDLKK